MSNDNFDIHNLDRYYSNKIKTIENDSELSDKNKEIILKYLRDSELGKTNRGSGKKKAVASGRNLQVAGFLNQMSKEWFKGKDLDKINSDDMEAFILELNKGKILTQFGQPYTSSTKNNIKKFIKKFYKWLYGGGKHLPDLVDWIDTSDKEKKIESIPELKEGVLKIIDTIPAIPDYRRRALIMVAFETGFREGEILSLQIKDVNKNPDGSYSLSCNQSKTKLRSVPICLPETITIFQKWLSQHPDVNNPNAQLWLISRIMAYKTIKLYGKKALGINITFHMLRHTGATYWATRLDRTTFCKNLGWAYNSSMPDRYIDYSRINHKKQVEIVRNESLSDLKAELQESKIKENLLSQQIKSLIDSQISIECDLLAEKLRISSQLKTEKDIQENVERYRELKQKNPNYKITDFWRENLFSINIKRIHIQKFIKKNPNHQRRGINVSSSINDESNDENKKEQY